MDQVVEWLRIYGPTFALIYAGLLLAVVLVNRVRWSNLHEHFERTLYRAINSGNAKSLADVLNLYRGIYQKTPPIDDHRHGLTSRLRAFLVQLMNGRLGGSLQGKQLVYPAFTPEVRAAWNELLTRLIKESEESASFSELPPLDQNILKDTFSFLESNDGGSAKRKLSELADSIRLRDRDLRRAQTVNRWSIAIAIISTILTVVFGILTLVKGR